MNKLFIAKRNIGFHFLFWTTLYLFWILVFQKRAFVFSRTMTMQFCYLFFIAGNYYFNILYTVPKFLYQKKYTVFALLMLSGIVAGSLLRLPVATYLNLHYFILGKPQPSFTLLFINSLTYIIIWVVSLVASKLIFKRVRINKYVD